MATSTRPGPSEAGLSDFELTRLPAHGEPWPINVWVVHPAEPDTGSSGKASVGVLYHGVLYPGGLTDQTNAVAAAKFGIATILGGDPAEASAAELASALQDTEARLGAEVSQDGPYPVAILLTGLLGGVADMVEPRLRLSRGTYDLLAVLGIGTEAAFGFEGGAASAQLPFLSGDVSPSATHGTERTRRAVSRPRRRAARRAHRDRARTARADHSNRAPHDSS